MRGTGNRVKNTRKRGQEQRKEYKEKGTGNREKNTKYVGDRKREKVGKGKGNKGTGSIANENNVKNKRKIGKETWDCSV